jgi:hypothetical protein
MAIFIFIVLPVVVGCIACLGVGIAAACKTAQGTAPRGVLALLAAHLAEPILTVIGLILWDVTPHGQWSGPLEALAVAIGLTGLAFLALPSVGLTTRNASNRKRAAVLVALSLVRASIYAGTYLADLLGQQWLVIVGTFVAVPGSWWTSAGVGAFWMLDDAGTLAAPVPETGRGRAHRRMV